MTLLVLGATGAQGGAVMRHLLAMGERPRFLTRSPASPGARALVDAGATACAADLTRPQTLPPAFDGVTAVFSVQDFYAPGGGLAGELAQGRAVIAAAKVAGVRHIVHSGMGDGHRPGGPAHFLSKALLERDLKASGLDWTVLGTVWFMDNLLNPAMKPGLIFPVLAGTLRADTPFHMLALDDLGAVAAQALTQPNAWRNRKINLAGDVMTVREMRDTYRRVTGQRAKRWRIPAWAFARMVPEFAAQLRWHNAQNFAFDTRALNAALPHPTRLADFLAAHAIRGL